MKLIPKPLGERLLLQPQQEQDRVVGSIFIPAGMGGSNQIVICRVLDVGSDCEMEWEVGDLVALSNAFMVLKMTIQNVDYHVAKEKDVLVKLVPPAGS